MNPELDPFSPAWREDPYPLYAELRDQAPVHYVESMKAFCVSRFDDVALVLKSPEAFSSRAMFTVLMNNGKRGVDLSWPGIKAMARLAFSMRVNPLVFSRSRPLIASDGERHTGLRSNVNRGFSPRRVLAWEPRIRELADGLLEPLREGEPFDLMRDLAVPLPVTIIAEMLGVPPERHASFKRWSDCIIHNASGPGRAHPFSAAFLDTLEELFVYFHDEMEARRGRGDLGDDLIGAVMEAKDEGAQPLSTVDLIQFVVLLMVAGNETTTNLIGNGATALLDHPEQLAAAANDPSLVPGLVEEVVRYDSPVQVVFRLTTRETEVAGVRIPKGANVAALLASANRDERRFPEPDRFDITRQSQGHVGFGFGKHFCLGASLARLEGRAAFEGLLPELVDVVAPPGKPERVDSFLVRGRRTLPIRLST
ncbi:MAG: cytochrome P450 [Deltaproteobacteria bacterium]|nr:cytochrome P450 [Deltaproteobacteria bacterium]